MMSSTEYNKELIHRYLTDRATESEIQEINVLIKDSEFREELSFQTDMYEALSENRKENLRNIIKEARKERESENNKSSKTKESRKDTKRANKAVLVLIGLILLIALYVYAQQYFSLGKTDAIFVEFYQPYPSDRVERGTDISTYDNYALAVSAYASEDYSRSLSLLRTLSDQTDRVKMFQAICHLELNHVTEAIDLLRSLRNSTNQNLSQQADWYLALAYLKNDKVALSKKILSNIKERRDHLYFSKANKLILKF